jgi:hypothetical protein
MRPPAVSEGVPARDCDRYEVVCLCSPLAGSDGHDTKASNTGECQQHAAESWVTAAERSNCGSLSAPASKRNCLRRSLTWPSNGATLTHKKLPACTSRRHRTTVVFWENIDFTKVHANAAVVSSESEARHLVPRYFSTSKMDGIQNSMVPRPSCPVFWQPIFSTCFER